MSSWQPIETAPKDGTPVLVCNAKRGGAWIAYYHPVYQSGYKPDNPWSSLMLNMRWHGTKWASTVPTHWQPIPAPYSEKETSVRRFTGPYGGDCTLCGHSYDSHGDHRLECPTART